MFLMTYDPKIPSAPKSHFLKTAMSLKNLQWEIFFKFDIFIFKYILDHCKSIPTIKIFLNFFRYLVIFCHFLDKEIRMVNIFKVDIFDLKYVLDHSKWIPSKKNFEKFSIFGHF